MKQSKVLEFGCVERLHVSGSGSLSGTERFGHCAYRGYECFHSGPIEPTKALFSYHTGIIIYRLQRDCLSLTKE